MSDQPYLEPRSARRWLPTGKAKAKLPHFHVEWSVLKLALMALFIIEQFQELCVWVANNWRPYCTAKASRTIRRVNYLDIVYQKHKQDVLDELKIMLNIEEVNIHQSEVFPYRTKAAKIVFDRMGEDKKDEIMKLVELYKSEGNNEKTRR
jgi:hypothetical protein